MMIAATAFDPIARLALTASSNSEWPAAHGERMARRRTIHLGVDLS